MMKRHTSSINSSFRCLLCGRILLQIDTTGPGQKKEKTQKKAPAGPDSQRETAANN